MITWVKESAATAGMISVALMAMVLNVMADSLPLCSIQLSVEIKGDRVEASAYDLGPRALRVYTALRERIVSAEWAVDTRIRSHTDLATTYGVAPLTVRQVLARLERDGLVSREQGRGTFVRRPKEPAVLIVEDEPEVAELLTVRP